jgi:hypothetical protein
VLVSGLATLCLGVVSEVTENAAVVLDFRGAIMGNAAIRGLPVRCTIIIL